MAMPAQGNMAMLARLLMGQKNGMPPQMQQPFMGLGGLPPYEQPGASLDPAAYISTPPGAQPGPGPSPAPPAMPQAPPAAAQIAIGQGGDAGVLQPTAPTDAPVDATTVPPMPPPVPVRDTLMQTLEQMAKAGTLPPQFAEMFPQFAGGSMMQGRGGLG